MLRIAGSINRPCTLLIAAPVTPKDTTALAQCGYGNENKMGSPPKSPQKYSKKPNRQPKFVKIPVYQHHDHPFLLDLPSEAVRCFTEVARENSFSDHKAESLLFGNGPAPFDEDEHRKKLALAHAYGNIIMEMPRLLKDHDYSIYRDELQFISKVGIIPSAEGRSSYKLTLQAWFKSLQIMYSDLYLDVLHMEKNNQDYTVTVRWGIRGHQRLITTNSGDVKFPFDGVSTFYIDVNGLIWKHVLDKKEKKQNSIFQALM